jgi:hypothetical protein
MKMIIMVNDGTYSVTPRPPPRKRYCSSILHVIAILVQQRWIKAKTALHSKVVLEQLQHKWADDLPTVLIKMCLVIMKVSKY